MIDPTDLPIQRRIIDSRAEYLLALDRLVPLCRQRLQIFDPDLEMLDLNHAARIETLRRFLSANRLNSVQIALHDAQFVRTRCPRLLHLLGEFAAQLAIYQTEGEAKRAQDRFVLADELHFVRRPVAIQGRGVYALNQTQDGRSLRERFEEICAASVPAVSATTLGL